MIQSSVVTEGAPGYPDLGVSTRVRSTTPARRRRQARIVPVVALGVAAFAAGALVGAAHEPAGQAAVERFAVAWERGDRAAMYGELSPDSRARVTRTAFARAYDTAMSTATGVRVAAGRPRRDGDAFRVGVRVATRAFGPVTGDVVVPAGDGGIDWAPADVFPGLREGERLSRTTRLAGRGELRARDGTALARGPDRTSSEPEVAADVVGQLGPIPPERRERLARLGVPTDAKVGVSGLERIFDERLLGTAGGVLRAGGRVLARRDPRAAAPVRTTISVEVERTAAAALAGRLGGTVVLDPRSGAILAFAGIAFSGLQPPGSTFKMITVTGGLEAGITRPSKVYPVETKAVLEGVDLDNANGEACGGTLVTSFALSCNSVFAPMGAEMGAERLVRAAEAYGFNAEPGVPGAATSTIPAASEIGDDLAVGSSAIGQGRVQATTLQMASVAATVARRGRRPRLTLDLAQARSPGSGPRATSRRVARQVDRLMRAVVRDGTGTAAAIPGVTVAGKTGTAELRSTKRCAPAQATPETCTPSPGDDPTDTDAWFAAYAPAGRPRVAVGVLLVASGAGGATAAPVARSLLEAGLQATKG
jgi:transpeptidase family protein/penicillin-binding protein